MNIHFVISRLGLLSIVLSTIMLGMAAIFFAAVQIVHVNRVDTHAAVSLMISASIGYLVGLAMWAPFRGGSTFLGRREALLLVAASWLCGAALAAMPYLLWAHLHFDDGQDHVFLNYVDCYFEAMSGLTTTGATVLSDIEAVPRILLLWRGLTHWLGGLGIVVLFVAVLPSLGVGGKKLFRVEAPGPAPEGLRPQIRESARMLGIIYVGITLAEVLLLWLVTPMNLFESVCHTFATIATGGFSTENASIGAYHGTIAVDLIVIVFMVLAGANFGLYYQLIRGKTMNVLRDTELRVYLIILAAAITLTAFSLVNRGEPITLTTGASVPASTGAALRESAFTAVSIQTTTGFCTSDFNRWPFLAQAMLIMLMFIGGCSGSTAGGIKVIRVWIAFKVMLAEIEHVFRPNVIRPVKLAQTTIDPDLKLGTIAYVLGIILLFTVGSGLIMTVEQSWGDAERCTYTTAATASVATLCTIGPGLAQVGAIENYGWFSSGSKMIMCLLMALGRLEVFAIIVLFSPRFWRGD